jgi:hypothetical protein
MQQQTIIVTVRREATSNAANLTDNNTLQEVDPTLNNGKNIQHTL